MPKKETGGVEYYNIYTILQQEDINLQQVWAWLAGWGCTKIYHHNDDVDGWAKVEDEVEMMDKIWNQLVIVNEAKFSRHWTCYSKILFLEYIRI